MHDPETRYPQHPAVPTRTLARQCAQDAGRCFGLHRAQGLDRRPRAAREPDCPRHGTRRGRYRALRGDRRRAAAGRDAGAGRRGRAGRGPPRALPHDRRYRGGRRSFAGREQCPRRHAPGRSGRGVSPPGRCGQHGGRHRGALRGLGAHRGETPAARQRRTGAARGLPRGRDRSGHIDGLRRHHKSGAPERGLGDGQPTGLPAWRLADQAPADRGPGSGHLRNRAFRRHRGLRGDGRQDRPRPVRRRG